MSTPHTPKAATKDAEMFEGFVDRECGKHDSVGKRAWCSTCTEWCYPNAACKGCELPSLRVRAEKAEAERDEALRTVGELRDERDRLQEQRDKLWERLTEGVDTVAVKARLLALAEAVLTDDWVCERCGWSANPDLSGPKPGPPQAPMNPTQRHA